MKTTVIRTGMVCQTDRLLNGYILKNITIGYESLASNEYGMAVRTDGTVTIRVYNGTLGQVGNPWTAVTPSSTYTVENDVVNEYIGTFSDRDYWFSSNCKKAEVTTNGTYIWPFIRHGGNLAYPDYVQISIGSWLSLPQSRMDVTRLVLFENLTIRQWVDMLDIKEATGTAAGDYGQVRMPRNITGNPKDFAYLTDKYFILNDHLYLYGYGQYISGATMTEAAQEIAKTAHAGKSMKFYLSQSPCRDNLYNKKIIFDGQGGYSVEG